MAARGPFHVVMVYYKYGQHDYKLCETLDDLFDFAIKEWKDYAKD